MTMMLGRTLPLILAAMVLSAGAANAQTMPWPGERPGGQPGVGPAPMMPPAPMMQPMPPPAMQPAGPAQQCVAQFTELREHVEKLAQNTKAVGERKGPREEMCKAIQVYAAAEEKWVKFTVDNATKCGIPPEVPKQLKMVHERTMTARKNICATGPTGPGGPAAGPSLSDALGTTHLPVPDGSHSGRGTLDTLTGNAIAR
jgi:hypothetical protein